MIPAGRQTPVGRDKEGELPLHSRTFPFITLPNKHDKANGPVISKGRFAIVILGILGTIIAIRALLVSHSPDFRFPDEGYYLDIASHIATENRYAVSPGSPVFATRQAPGLPVTLGLLGKVIPLSSKIAKITNGMAGVLTAVLYALAVWRLTRRPAATLWILALVGLHPTLLYTSITNYPQTFQGFWMAALTLTWTWRLSDRAPSPNIGALQGSLIGLGALFAPTHLLVAPAALAFYWKQGRSWIIRYTVWATLAGALVLTPWTLRNLAVEHAFIPFSTSGGEQLYLGFNPQAGMNTGVHIAPTLGLVEDLRGASSGAKQEQCFRNAALNWMVKHPRDTLRLWLLKALNFFRWDNGKMATASEQSVTRAWIARLTSLGVFGLALFGTWRNRGRGSPWPSTAVVLMLALAAGHACFISRYRYRLPFEPFLLLVGVVGTFVDGRGTRYSTEDNP